ncbi:MAG: hypothetical protein GX601_19880 [Anaerolineales bacterium]|nr:hypothetical protein [Anaerolineales bacterium]
MGLGDCTIIELQEQDDLPSIRQRLSWLDPGRVALVLPWDLVALSDRVDFDLLRREANRRQLEIAIVSPDPERRAVAHSLGWPAFASARDAQRAAVWRLHRPKPVKPPPKHWWDAPVDLRPRRSRRSPRWVAWIWLLSRIAIFLVALAVLAGSAYLIVPRAEVTLYAAGREFETIVLVSADPEIEEVDQVNQVIPARRVGIEIEGAIEVPTTGLAEMTFGSATGEVLFTNLLAQDYRVRAGTVVRTSSSSYPLRFRTTAEVVVPAGGQATAPIESMDSVGGNVGAYQINQVEGVAGSALRVINPRATGGAESRETHIVVQADYDQARTRLMRQLLDQAHAEISALDLLQATEFVPRQSLRIEAVPKQAYSRFIGEQAETVGLEMRLLVSGLAVDVHNAEVVAYVELARRLPPDFTLVDAHFDVGEVAEEDIGPGQFSFFVTGYGYAAAELSPERALDIVLGKELDEARQQLMAELPLAQPPIITVWPEHVRRIPLLPLRVSVDIKMQSDVGAELSLAR